MSQIGKDKENVKHGITNEHTDEGRTATHIPVREDPVLISAKARSELPLYLALQFLGQVQDAVRERGFCLVMIAGAEAVDTLAEGLFGTPLFATAQQHSAAPPAHVPLSTLRCVDWSKVYFTTADEQADFDVSPSSSNYAYLLNNLVCRLPGSPHALNMWCALNHPRLMALKFSQRLRDIVKDNLRTVAERDIAASRKTHLGKPVDTADKAAVAARRLAFLQPRSLPVWVSWPRLDVVLASVGAEGELGALYEQHAFYRENPAHMPRYLDQLAPEDPALQPEDALCGLHPDSCYVEAEQEDEAVAYIPWHSNELSGKRNPHSAAVTVRVARVDGIVDAPAGGPMRVGVGAAMMNRARRVLLVATGKTGARAVRKCVQGYQVLNEREGKLRYMQQYPRGAPLSVVLRHVDGSQREVVQASKHAAIEDDLVLPTSDQWTVEYHRDVPPASVLRPRFGSVEWCVDNEAAAALE